jgi:hypothetical protein
VRTISKLALRGFGLVNPLMREFVEMFYQYTEPQGVDSSAFEQKFGFARPRRRTRWRRRSGGTGIGRTESSRYSGGACT